MRNKKLAAVTIILSLVLFIIHYHAIRNHWYTQFPFLDLILHFLGGACLALSTLYITGRTKYILLATFILGVLWEIFELIYDITGWPWGTFNYNLDTTVDIVMDMLGALAVWGIYKRKQTKDEYTPDIS